MVHADVDRVVRAEDAVPAVTKQCVRGWAGHAAAHVLHVPLLRGGSPFQTVQDVCGQAIRTGPMAWWKVPRMRCPANQNLGTPSGPANVQVDLNLIPRGGDKVHILVHGLHTFGRLMDELALWPGCVVWQSV